MEDTNAKEVDVGEVDVELTADEQKMFRELLVHRAECNRDGCYVDYGEVGAFENTEIDEWIQDGVDEVINAKDELDAVMDDIRYSRAIPKFISVNQQRYNAIQTERRKKAQCDRVSMFAAPLN